MKSMPEHICRSFKEAFIYDGYRNFKGRFRIRYLFDAMMRPAYSATVLLRLQQYYFWKSAFFKNKNHQSAVDRFLARFHSFLSLFAGRLNFTLNAGFEANSCADIEPGLFIHHPQAVVISGTTKIGKNCHIFKNVLIGDKNGHCPTIKENVTLYANSVVIGKVTLNNNTVVAPNSVVIHDVEEGMVVAGIPAQPIKENDQIYVQIEGTPFKVSKA